MARLALWVMTCVAISEPAVGAEKSAPADPEARKAAFVNAVVRGAGLMPWQTPGPSPEEVAFRKRIEERKTRMLTHVRSLERPVLLTAEQIARARQNIKQTAWGKKWYAGIKDVADHVVAQDDAWIDRMIEPLTPWHHYGWTCPNCVGKKSQEGVGGRILRWNRRTPDVVRCNVCGQTYPDPKFPETARLQAPRMGQTFTFYLNDRERADPDDRSGKLAWHWVRRPIHVSFSGNVRHHKVDFITGAARSLALTYRLTGDPRYAAKTAKILVRLASCYRHWLYCDYWDSVADCDPLYAAWHDQDLKLEWKRHLSTAQYKRDTPTRAAMLQRYWGAGRYWPSTGSVGMLSRVCLAYDLTCDAKDAGGRPVWTDAMRRKVERDLLLEWVFEAEPYVGGEGKATCPNNKAPRIYMAQASVAKTLGIAELADVALRGYQIVRDQSFTSDGFSHESPSYTNMYLGTLLRVPDTLHGFTWPAGFEKRKGTLDLYGRDPMLRYMLYSVVDQIRPDGRYPPLSDTSVGARPSAYFFEVGLRHYPERFAGKMPTLYAGRQPTEYALFNLDAKALVEDAGFDLPEIFYPGWMTAMLRHGQGRTASMVAIPANPPGGHRHYDNLSLFYVDRGQVILGDQGYIGDMPQNGWIHATQSHSLVVVDETDQRMKGRTTRLHMMFTTPTVSAVECSSTAYAGCREYRRLTAMIKGPGAQTFLVDVFRVAGVKKHAFRVSSELAASDSAGGAIAFVGVELPPEPPLPNFGGSIDRKHIYGLRDVRVANRPRPGWQAIWKQKDRRYRLTMLSPVGRLDASNGPGQEYYHQLGRRVRYVDAVNEGEDLVSTFAAVHEPSGADGTYPVTNARLLAVPQTAGKNAVAVEIESKWGTVLLFSDFDHAVEIEGVTFAGKFGLVKTAPDGHPELIGCGARTLRRGDLGFADKPARWTGKVVEHTGTTLTTDTPMPEGFGSPPNGCRCYVMIPRGEYVTGYDVGSIAPKRIAVRRFALESPKTFDLPELRIVTK